ncbi:tRNA pseudouridine(55) synthase TruB [bacterium]|nr:tRNA pseudouridine(55) synthase TruB [bacterium]
MPDQKLFDAGTAILIDKPATWTSFDVVNKIRNISKAKKVGHCGTLDPFATGLLIICTGKATKFVETFLGLSKEYIAEFEFGKTTDTLDVDGKVIEEKPVDDLGTDQLQSVLDNFIGEIEQIPPQYSAIKVGGVPLYKKARRGESVEIQARSVRIDAFKILQIEKKIVTVCIKCSKGTYIRALARDVGQQIGCGAYVKNLRRTMIGNYQITDALTLDELKNWIQSVHATH